MRKLVYIISALAIIIGFAGAFIYDLHLEKAADRNVSYSLKKEQRQLAREAFANADIFEVLYGAQAMTENLLDFTFEKQDIAAGKANCTGYAQLYAALLNEGFRLNNYPFTARPVVGSIKYGDTNLCGILSTLLPAQMKGFFKDHDFVEIQMEGETFYSDASFSDVLGYNLETDANNPSHLTCSLMMSLFVIALILFCLSVYFYGKGRLKTSAIFAITLATWWVVSALITAVNMYGMPGGYLADALYVLWIISPLLAIFAIWKTRFFQSKTTRLLLTVAAVILFLASPFIWGAGALFSDPGPVNSAYLRHYDIPAYVN